MKNFTFALLIALLAGSIAACSSEEEAMDNAAIEEVAEDQSANEETNEEETGEEGEAGTTTAEENTPEVSDIEMMHVHGLGFSGDGARLYVPSHDGLKVFENGVWSEAAAEPHDYMGFVMVDDGFYSSGHPGPGSSLKNPFGVVKTTDMGQNLEMLDLYQEVDFHGMAVGYNSHAIYVINPQTNSRMDDIGLYYSTDETETWTKSEMTGLQGPIFSIAVHPTDEATVALGTSEGVFLSNDFGQTFDPVSDSPTTAVTFSPAGNLVAGSVSGEVTLTIFDSETNEPQLISIPELSEENTIGYIAGNPQDENQITFTTVEKDMYMTKDFGGNWSQIAEKGTGINLEAGTKQ
ncbi:F510_1955 family glycosylhydrolase [uncultured Planococcus sp.]|uniref:F510_1955 family glycosylhydrolase n=1 Tax=uncultured Planococcus sp. TaxID=337815 RepID=UPI002605F7A7|nr:glycosyl hydrolase [uncultured Planococcus sp.]